MFYKNIQLTESLIRQELARIAKWNSRGYMSNAEYSARRAELMSRLS